MMHKVPLPQTQTVQEEVLSKWKSAIQNLYLTYHQVFRSTSAADSDVLKSARALQLRRQAEKLLLTLCEDLPEQADTNDIWLNRLREHTLLIEGTVRQLRSLTLAESAY